VAKKTKKAKEDDDIECVQSALDAFDPDAAIGAYKMDGQISKLRETYALPPSAHRNIRTAIHRAAQSALGRKFHKSIRHPRDEAATREFFVALQTMVALDRRIKQYDIEQAFSVAHREPDYELDDATILDPAEQAQRIDADIEAIQASSAKAVSLIEKFTRVTIIPEFKKDGSRAILFTHHFIEEIALEWPWMVARLLSVKDLPTMTALIATALSDFKYPLAQSQQSSDDWLSDRIRKQIFRNSSRSK
jgi:hypothetical protein